MRDSAAPTWQIRQLDAVGDGAACDRLGDLIVAAYINLPGGYREPEYEAELRDVRSRAAASCVLAAIAQSGGDVLGGVTYVTGPADPYAELLVDGDSGMRMLAVAPDQEGRGIGRALVAACLDRARAEGRRRLVLHTTPWMTRAHALYEGLGFRRAPELDWVPLPEVPLRAYVYDLT